MVKRGRGATETAPVAKQARGALCGLCLLASVSRRVELRPVRQRLPRIVTSSLASSSFVATPRMRIVLLLVSTISSWKGMCIWSLCCVLCSLSLGRALPSDGRGCKTRSISAASRPMRSRQPGAAGRGARVPTNGRASFRSRHLGGRRGLVGLAGPLVAPSGVACVPFGYCRLASPRRFLVSAVVASTLGLQWKFAFATLARTLATS